MFVSSLHCRCRDGGTVEEKYISSKDVLSMVTDENESEIEGSSDEDDNVDDRDWIPPAALLGEKAHLVKRKRVKKLVEMKRVN